MIQAPRGIRFANKEMSLLGLVKQRQELRFVEADDAGQNLIAEGPTNDSGGSEDAMAFSAEPFEPALKDKADSPGDFGIFDFNLWEPGAVRGEEPALAGEKLEELLNEEGVALSLAEDGFENGSGWFS